MIAFSLFFCVFRIIQLLTMAFCMGVMSWYVHGYTYVNILTPGYILVLFIVSVLAVVWGVITLIAVGCTRKNGLLIALIDIGVFAGLIAGVYELRGLGPTDCDNAIFGEISIDLGPFGIWGASWGSPYSWNINMNCSLLKGAWVVAIINIFLWPITAAFATLNYEWESKNHHDDHRGHDYYERRQSARRRVY